MKGERVVWGIGTSRTIRAHWALIELELPYRIETVRTRTPDTETPEFLRLNPRGKIPVLQDGQHIVTESAAIITYLAETYRNGSLTLIPETTGERARYFEWMSFICMELDATSLYVLRRHWSLPRIYGYSEVANKAAEAYFARMIDAAADIYDGKKPFLLGDSFSGVDILMTSTLDWAIGYGQPLPELFRTYRDRISSRNGYVLAQKANIAE